MELTTWSNSEAMMCLSPRCDNVCAAKSAQCKKSPQTTAALMIPLRGTSSISFRTVLLKTKQVRLQHLLLLMPIVFDMVTPVDRTSSTIATLACNLSIFIGK